MPREAQAYLADVVAACDAIAVYVSGVDLQQYLANREKRSAVEREFIIIGEAIKSLGEAAPELFARIDEARRVVDFRNQLTHGYAIVNDRLVWGYALRNSPELRSQCAALLDELAGAE